MASGRRVRAYIGLGANVGDARRTLTGAVRALAALPDVRLADVSPLYLTRPVGISEQSEFHNAVVALDVPGGPDPETAAVALLIALKRLEEAFGRQRRERWGPREIDLDLLLFGRQRIHVARPQALGSRDVDTAGPRWLIVPHASASERLFVLAPLADLAPGLVPPGWSATVRTMRDHQMLVEGPDAVRRVGTWRGLEEGWA